MSKSKKSLFSFFALLFFIPFFLAVECPFEMINESYPGSCGRYLDENNDGFCDLSQDLEPLTLSFTDSNDSEKDSYNTLLITLTLVFIYVLGFFIFRRNKGWFNAVNYKKIWNFSLLISFLVVAITSLVYLLRMDFGFNINIRQISLMHIRWGIAMIIIAIFHALWHMKYFKSCYFNFGFLSEKKKCLSN